LVDRVVCDGSRPSGGSIAHIRKPVACITYEPAEKGRPDMARIPTDIARQHGLS